MRALRLIGLVAVVAVAGLLSGEAAGALPTASAIIAGVSGAQPATDPAGRPALAPAAPPAAPLAQPVAAPALPAPQALPAAPAPAPAGKPATKPARVAATVAGTPCRATATACVDLSANRAWLISNGKVQYGPVPITHGRKGFRTPTGTFRVFFKSADHVSSIYDADMPYSVFFNGGIAFHQGSLKVLSHGCIHLSGKAARTFFAQLGYGEVVQVVR